jgi:hypothetical protein
MPGRETKIRAVRREYHEAKKLYNQMGKKARGKPKSSAVYKDYKLVKRAYKKVGQQLGKLTGLKPRR